MGCSEKNLNIDVFVADNGLGSDLDYANMVGPQSTTLILSVNKIEQTKLKLKRQQIRLI
jgi:hypothetical protein